jgi:adenylosuccinate lyase
MNRIWSEEGKVELERELWLSVLRAQERLGMDVPPGVIDRYQDAKERIDLEHIKKIELRTKHDVKAKIEAFNLAAGDIEYIHRGMTSRDLTDNVEQLQIKKSMRLVLGKYVSVLRHLLDKAEEYKHIELTGRTHHQAAQTTLLGRRFAMLADELLIHLEEFDRFFQAYPLRGIKGPVGTQFDMIQLLGSKEKAEKLEEIIANELGFSETLDATAQVYPRSLDYKLINHLSALSAPCENFAKTMRLMAGYELVTEGFVKGQVGSSIMPHKMNTRSSERICAFSELLKMYADGASRLSGDQWEEGDVSCSAVRRVILPDSFYSTDGLIETTLTVLNQMGAYPAVIEKELERYLPFLATTEILIKAYEHGLGREQAHGIIKKYALSEALNMREKGISENRLIERLSQDPVFKEAGISLEELEKIVSDKRHFIGNAVEQIEQVKRKCKPILEKYSSEAAYEPKDIL